MTLRLRRRLILIAAAIVLLATAIEYGVLTAPTSHAVAHDGTIISQN